MTYRRSAILVFWAAIILLLASSAAAQAGGSGSSSQGATANALPLSGKAATGSVTATESSVPGTTTSVNTLNPVVQVQGPYAGSTSSAAMPFSGKLSLAEAIQRGLHYNLGSAGLARAVQQVHGQSRVVRSALMPNLNGSLAETVEQLDLKATGLRLNVPPALGFRVPIIVGPFNFFDLRARLSQTVFDGAALNNYRSASELVKASQFSVQDARDLVVLAVGGAYLQVIAARARVASAQAQLETADALYKQTLQQRQVGLVAQVDADRSEVQFLTRKQRLISLQNDLAKQKINLARMTGLSPTDQYDVAGEIPFAPAPALSFDDALHGFAPPRLSSRSDARMPDATRRQS